MKSAHIVGAGGIGVYLGWFLARAGWDIQMVETKASKLEAGEREGLGLNGEHEKRVRFTSFDDWSPSDRVLTLICVKTYDNSKVISRLGNADLLIPVQNGFNPELEGLSHHFEGIAAFVSECDPKRPSTRVTRPGEVYFGGRQKLTTDQHAVIESLANGLRSGGCEGVKVVPSIAPYKASKLMYNAAISPLASAAGVDNGELLRDPLAQHLFFALLRENYSILTRRNIPLARIGPFHPRVVNFILRLPGLAKVMGRFFYPALRGTYCSMSADIESGRTEIEAYNGYLERLAGGDRCPINTAILQMLQKMRENSLTPHRDLLVGLSESLGMRYSL